MRPFAPRRSPGSTLALFALTLLVSGCPDAPHTPDALSPDAVGDGGGDADAVEFEVVPGACVTAADCVATGPLPSCRQLVCEDGQCTTAQAADGAACDDGDLCTNGSVCQAGSCVGGTARDCDDGNPCTNDACDPASGCVHTFHQKPCDDGSVCTTGDTCFKGVCQGTVIDCNDQNPCTDDFCDKAAGCQWVQRTGACSDGDACTQGDTCVDGTCVPGEVVDCDDGNPCTAEVCDPLFGCRYTVVDGPCDDGNACTIGDLCMDGECLGTLVQCDDGNACTSDYCDPAAGCVFTQHTGACSDGDPCTLNDVCHLGECIPGPLDPSCCDDDQGCDDGDACTLDACVDGYCQFQVLDCDDGSACTADACVEGVCQHTPLGPLADGTLLDEGFEATDLAGWTLVSNNLDVVWQRDTSRSHTGDASLYLGKVPEYSYDFGVTTATASRTLSLPPGQVWLGLWVYFDVEDGGCSYDRLDVLVNGVLLTPAVCNPFVGWQEHGWDLTPFAGDTVTLALRFDTVDGAANEGAGLWIDDVTVQAEAPQGCCLSNDDCAGGGTGCLAEVCHPERFVCGVLEGAEACDDDDPCTIDACEASGACTHTEAAPGCCVADTDCPEQDTLPCATPVCLGGTCGVDASSCCEEASECPGDPARPCAAPTCEAGFCGLDASACCQETGCDDGLACTTDVCGDDGACTHAPIEGCCERDADCAPGAACEVVSCVDAVCVTDDAACCVDASTCPPPPPGNECAVPVCNDGLCGLDASGC